MDIRWEQRFDNYNKALSKLEEVAVNRAFSSLSDLEKEGLIQRFEYTFELAWKTLQDLLAYKGYEGINGPNQVLEQAVKDGYIGDVPGWRAMKKSRELTSHTYDSATADEIAREVINKYAVLLRTLALVLNGETGRQQTNFT